MDHWRETPSGLLVPASVDEPAPPTAVDLFCGCGGFSVGIIEAGFHVLAGIDKDVDAAISYMTNLGAYPIDIRFVEDEDRAALEKRLERSLKRSRSEAGIAVLEYRSGSNRARVAAEPQPPHEDEATGPTAWEAGFEGVPVFFLGDVRKLSGADILDAIGLQRGELDLVVGGPPCQGYSVAGKRNVADPRNTLVFEFARLVVEMRPKTLCMENVPGILSMVTEGGVPVIDEVCRILERGSFGEFDALRTMLSDDPTRRLAKRTQPSRRARKQAARARAETDAQLELLPKRSKKASSAEAEMSAGACRECGCTEDEACVTDEGPCYWADIDMTICSACVGEAAEDSHG